MSQKPFVLWFKDINLRDVSIVGGKNASLGEMYTGLNSHGVKVPNGFVVTTYAYNHFLEQGGLIKKIKDLLVGLDTKDIKNLQKRGAAIRQLIIDTPFPEEINKEIKIAYRELSKSYNQTNTDVAVRSSATAEDLPGASFAGQQETYLNVSGEEHLYKSVRKCFASLFTDRAISYRVDKGFANMKIALSVAVQKMARSDLAASGVMFTIDTETGFHKVLVINGAYGLGEMVVQGKVTPDEYITFKPLVAKGFSAIIGKKLGTKETKMIYSGDSTKIVSVKKDERVKYCLTDKEIIKLSKWGMIIEDYFSKKYKRVQPMDIEWAKDGKSGELFIVQARPETVYSITDEKVYREYKLLEKGIPLVSGAAVGAKIASGKVRVINDVKDIGQFKKGEVLVTDNTDPDWEPIMKIASAIVTDLGGRTSHAAIVSRELGIPAIVGTGNATKRLKTGQLVTVDCSGGGSGAVYAGHKRFKVEEHHLDHIPKTKTKIMVNIGAPEEAFRNYFLPVQGVGLGRLEFIISSHIQVHPKALMEFSKNIKSKDPRRRAIAKKVEKLTVGYADKKQYYVDRLAEGVAKIAATFYPHEVIIRFSDFKTNEYRTLLGGELYEPNEENPMMGWRGASRYYDPAFKEAFGLECLAIKKVREKLGLKNLVPMIPFCRTIDEGREVVSIMESYGLGRKLDRTLKIYMMCEIPSNVILAEEFLKIFDGMSIGTNDLTQLTLGLDRDSAVVTHVSNEKDKAVMQSVAKVIQICRKHKKYAGICGQAPSDYPDFAEFLVKEGIGSISLNPDTIIKTLIMVAKEEKRLKR